MLHLASVHGYTSFHDRNPKTGKLTRVMMAHPTSLRLFKVYYYVVGVDSTYKTNMYKMPLVQLVGFTPVGLTFLIAYAILTNEKTESYVWIMENLRQLLGPKVVPNVIVTDRELGLMSALLQVFPTTYHILCLWHVNRNVENRAKEIMKSGELALGFMRRWSKLVECKTEVELDIVMEELSTYRYQKLIRYLEDTWYVHTFKFVRCYTNDVCHFGTTTTSPVESAHSTLKRWLGTSTHGLDSLWKKIDALMNGQHREIGGLLEASRNRHTHDYYSGLFSLLRGFVSLRAVRLMEDEFQRGIRLGDDLVDGCGCSMIGTHGLPCACMLHDFYHKNIKVHPDHCHAFWRTLDYMVDGSSELDDLDLYDFVVGEARKLHSSVRRRVIQSIHSITHPGDEKINEPDIIEKPKGRPRSSTTRNKSRFEHLQRKYPTSTPTSTSKCKSSSQPQLQKPWCGTYTSGTMDTFPWSRRLPEIFGEYVTGWFNPRADGHCGYRVMAHVVHQDENRWRDMRLALLGEIRHAIYNRVYGADAMGNGSVHYRISFLDDGGGCGDEHWMDVRDCYGYATLLNWVIVVVCHYYDARTDSYEDYSCTYLPLRAKPGVKSPDAIMWIINVGDHWVRLFVDDAVPLPPICITWKCHDKSVDNWDKYYTSRIDRWRKHYGRVDEPPVYLNVPDDSC